ncbi:MAG: TIGR03905 family TSCPD domain-containing protein [Candidatus Fimenecus sp.]
MYSYRTRGTCSQQIDVELDGDIIKSVRFYGGCNGNLQGISAIVVGKTVDEVAKAFEGIRCGMRPTSCPDQLVKALRAAQQAQEQA